MNTVSNLIFSTVCLGFTVLFFRRAIVLLLPRVCACAARGKVIGSVVGIYVAMHVDKKKYERHLSG